MSDPVLFSLTATCAAGVESLLVDEIIACGGAEPFSYRGGVSWQGSLESGYRACLWSRFASRILLQIGDFPAVNEEDLYQGALGAIDWQRHLSLNHTFSIDCTLGRTGINHSQFAGLRVKDGLADFFRERTGERPSVDTVRPAVRFSVYVDEGQARVAVNLSGESLHRRGYRTDTGVAPLKETLAAAIVALAGCDREMGPDQALLDPMCGSGTLLIEAALLLGDSAPGLSRSAFGFQGWPGHDSDLWSRLVDEAVAREEMGLDRPWPLIVGYDCDPVAVAAARKNIERAGLADRIQVHQGQLARLRPPTAKGLLVCNPPYGERLGEAEEAIWLYRCLGRILAREFVGWRLGLFTSQPDLADRLGQTGTVSHRLYNGPIACRLVCSRGIVPVSDEAFVWPLAGGELTGDGADFANRLRKNLTKSIKWAQKQGVSCYRVYDRDLPDYNVAIDLYEKWIHVQEYAPPSQMDETLASRRFSLVLSWLRELLGARRERIFIKTRSRQKGRQQYEKKGRAGKMFEVREGECFFLVNLSDYLDTGLFLDHRPVRLRIGERAAGKRFLNLFSYTGTATIHAAVGGAESTTSVDLSSTYSAWARMNLALNGFGGRAHEVVQADCLQWLTEDRSSYDLIFVDPPTFSNTKKKQQVFDIQTDHVRLLTLAMARLAPTGLLIFSTNFRKFELDLGLSEHFQVHEISRETIPADFSRNSKIHCCWEFQRLG